MLHEYFLEGLKTLGTEHLPCDLMTQVPYVLRFQIGGEEQIYLADHRKPNGAYIDHGADRAMEIYRHLPAVPRIMRIDGCPNLTIPGLPHPHESVGGSDYWDLRKENSFLRKLFREIIRAELDPAGIEELTGNVYFMNPGKGLLFQLWDDRWAYGAAGEPALLRPLLGSPWLLDMSCGMESAAEP